MQVALILLAAGESKRMGTPKQLLPYKGQCLIRHAAGEAVASNCCLVVVVLGAYCDRIQPELDDLPVEICQNPHWQRGMSASISVGIQTIAAISPDLNAVIIALADQPLVTAQVYNQLIKRYRETEQKAIASTYANTLGVPALFDRALFPELLNLDGGGAKQLLKKSDRQWNLDVPEAAIDLDTPTDYQNIIS